MSAQNGAVGSAGQVVGLAIVDDLVDARRVLAAQRAYPESLRGLWEFPGGKAQEGRDRWRRLSVRFPKSSATRSGLARRSYRLRDMQAGRWITG
ncbi:NUDIX hydrolase [Pseudoglutamicibacter albus]|uniref:hypothetical protein n=1 Tax=Pseudoglutamicibacter albus TaxID=98671 RepID=UPI00361F85BF